MTDSHSTVTIDGQQVSLNDVIWLERESCGCVVAAVIALVPGGWTIATAGQALTHFNPTVREYEQALPVGRTAEAVTAATYRAKFRANWRCDQHPETRGPSAHYPGGLLDGAHPGKVSDCPSPGCQQQESTERSNAETVRVQATEYEVNLLPEDGIDYYVFAITVRYRGEGRWAVQRGEHACLGADGAWADGVKPYGRGDDWLDAHRFDLDTALELAKAAAPHVTVNGRTAKEALAMRASREQGGKS